MRVTVVPTKYATVTLTSEDDSCFFFLQDGRSAWWTRPADLLDDADFKPSVTALAEVKKQLGKDGVFLRSGVYKINFCYENWVVSKAVSVRATRVFLRDGVATFDASDSKTIEYDKLPQGESTNGSARVELEAALQVATPVLTSAEASVLIPAAIPTDALVLIPAATPDSSPEAALVPYRPSNFEKGKKMVVSFVDKYAYGLAGPAVGLIESGISNVAEKGLVVSLYEGGAAAVNFGGNVVDATTNLFHVGWAIPEISKALVEVVFPSAQAVRKTAGSYVLHVTSLLNRARPDRAAPLTSGAALDRRDPFPYLAFPLRHEKFEGLSTLASDIEKLADAIGFVRGKLHSIDGASLSTLGLESPEKARKSAEDFFDAAHQFLRATLVVLRETQPLLAVAPLSCARLDFHFAQVLTVLSAALEAAKKAELTRACAIFRVAAGDAFPNRGPIHSFLITDLFSAAGAEPSLHELALVRVVAEAAARLRAAPELSTEVIVTRGAAAMPAPVSAAHASLLRTVADAFSIDVDKESKMIQAALKRLLVLLLAVESSANAIDVAVRESLSVLPRIVDLSASLAAVGGNASTLCELLVRTSFPSAEGDGTALNGQRALVAATTHAAITDMRRLAEHSLHAIKAWDVVVNDSHLKKALVELSVKEDDLAAATSTLTHAVSLVDDARAFLGDADAPHSPTAAKSLVSILDVVIGAACGLATLLRDSVGSRRGRVRTANSVSAISAGLVILPAALALFACQLTIFLTAASCAAAGASGNTSGACVVAFLLSSQQPVQPIIPLGGPLAAIFAAAAVVAAGTHYTLLGNSFLCDKGARFNSLALAAAPFGLGGIGYVIGRFAETCQSLVELGTTLSAAVAAALLLTVGGMGLQSRVSAPVEQLKTSFDDVGAFIASLRGETAKAAATTPAAPKVRSARPARVPGKGKEHEE